MIPQISIFTYMFWFFYIYTITLLNFKEYLYVILGLNIKYSITLKINRNDMGFFKDLFSSNDEMNSTPTDSSSLDWYKLTKIDQLEHIKQISNEKLVVIFKHSTRCGISRLVWNQFQASADFPKGQVELFYLDLLSYRSVSDAISQEFQVMHQSPQLIILQHEEVVHHASHSAIVSSSVHQFLSE